jgi:hypothetical protein
MKRFDYYDDEENEDESNEPPISPQEYKELIAEDQALQQESVELTYLALNQKLIAKSIKVCEKSFFWKFYSLQTQLSMISKVYFQLRDLQEI